MFNLINILGQNTLPEQVEINKQNIAILADEVEKLGYQPKGVYDAETEYNHNDVEFYDNKLYVVTSDAAIVGVLPTNTTYWQQVTGDIRGQQGAQGAQGPAGADGTDGVDGKPVLWYNLNILLPNTAAFNTLLTESSHEFTKAYFSRVGDVGDEFMCFVNIADSNTSFALIYRIIAWPEGINYCTAVRQNVYASMTGRKGDTGATGKEALVYGRKINFTWNGETEQLLSGLSLSFQDFNRVPELNEDFVAILHDTVSDVDYLAMGEVQTISGENVTSIVATDINRITGVNGQNGTNGTNGTDGKDALVCTTIIETSSQPVLNQQKAIYFTNLNRSAEVGETFSVVYSYNSRSWIAIGQITGTQGSNAYTYTIVALVETTGAAGSGVTKKTVNPVNITEIVSILTSNPCAKVSTIVGGHYIPWLFSVDTTNNEILFYATQFFAATTPTNVTHYSFRITNINGTPVIQSGYSATFTGNSMSTGSISSVTTLSNWKIEYLE